MAKVRVIARAGLLLLLCMALDMASAYADSGKRYALVIGNGAYQHVQSLPNPTRDASDMAESLTDLGFEVFTGLDLDREQFHQLISDFRTAAAEAESVVFYYAGHGFQLNGLNHLVPVDAALRNRSEIDGETFVLDEVISLIHSWDRQTVVFLDACRNNPLPPSLQDRTSLGLAPFQTGHGIFISFATEPGKITWDGRGRNSPFTRALLTHITRPQQSISELMIRVRNEVLTETIGAQMPWDQSSLRSQFYFNLSPGPAISEELATGAPAIVLSPSPPAIGSQSATSAETMAQKEDRFWDRVAQSQQAADLQSYLDIYPEGRFAGEANDRLAALAAAEEEARRAREEDRFWGRVAQSQQAADLHSYLEAYPDGRFAGEANDRLAALAAAEAETQRLAEEERLWGRVAQSLRPADLQSYLDTYPDGRFAGEANDRLAALSAAEAEAQRLAEEETFWGRVGQSQQAADVRSYLDSYPDGRFAGQANERLAALAAAEAEARRLAEEERFWGRVGQSQQAADVRSYLDAYPDGRFAGEANDRLAALATDEPSGRGIIIGSAPAPTIDDQDGMDAEEEEALSDRELVIALQERLKEFGCYSGSIDGIWGSNSRRGMVELLRNAKVDGSPDPDMELLSKAKSISKDTPECAKPKPIRTVQPKAPRQPSTAKAAAPPRQPARARAPAPPPAVVQNPPSIMVLP